MSKIFHVALREFLATVMTKAFIIGVLIVPLLMFAAIAVIPALMNRQGPAVTGRVAVIDRTGDVAERIKENLDSSKMAEEKAAETNAAIDKAVDSGMLPPEHAQMVKAGAHGKAARFTVEILPPDTEVDPIKASLLETDVADRRLALAVIPAGAVKPTAANAPFENFELYGAPRLDPEILDDQIRDGVAAAITDARLKASNLDPALVRRIMDRPRGTSRVVTAGGDRQTNTAAAIFLPMGFMMLLWISVFTAGQGLLTTTIEEKSSRIMEVLLSAASPIQIMTGKILGQMGVGVVLMGVYAMLGIGSLVVFSYMHLLEWTDIGLLLVYFVIAFFMIACMMASIGSAVNDIREAQSLMTPVMLVLMVPMILWLPISRAPNAMFAQVLSFVPPISPFVMVVRIAGAEPIPFWQIPVSILVGIVSVYFAVRICAKIFRIGVLMYGKPPDLKTLIKWVRMA